MLNLLGESTRYCDGVSRRSFLSMGTLAVGGLTLPKLLAAERSAAASNKSVIMVYLSGGQSHQDTFDLKPNAPKEVRGEFNPIDSSLPGLQVGELLPHMSKVMHHCNLIRSVVGQRDEHTSFQNLTGYPMNQSLREGRPNFGSVVAKVQGPTNPVTPPFVDLFPTMKHRPYNSSGAGYLGSAFNQVKADGEDLASMKLRYIDASRFSNRKQLLTQFDEFRRDVDTRQVGDVEENYQRAFEVLTSSRLVDAMDVEKEDPKLRERYGKGSRSHLGDGAPAWNDQLLVARRLVEAGVRVVTVAYGFWDTHGTNFKSLKQRLPAFDKGISALIEDIHNRRMDKDTTVIVWDEFGRTPKITKNAGRDHWAPVNYALLTGGGMPTGQVIGSTDKNAGYAATRPVDYRDILATLYHNMGIDLSNLIRDATERPVRILPEQARPVRELIAVS
ncbi:MAG: hypothetical protein CMJ78_10205 [Planctomycetaceae bacterium]|nr:hypothetical protein [Planctomycetaceae bacterium]